MRSLDINKANLDNQRNAVQEERRLRVDNQPYGQTFEKTGEQAYDNPAYKHSVIGSMEDLNAASVDDVATFFKTYYAPNNAVLSIVGDVDTKSTMALVEKYFGVIARQPDPKRPDLREPPHTAERRAAIEDRAGTARPDRHRLHRPARGRPRQRADRRAVGRAVERPELAFQPGHRPAEAARDHGVRRVARTREGLGSSRSARPWPLVRRPKTSRRRFTRRSRR